MQIDALPHIDEHVTTIEAGSDTVFRALSDTLDHSFAGSAATRYARLVGCTTRTASGPRPLTEGSTLPGFRVAAAVPARTLVLEGAHRFSVYALTFHLTETSPAHTRLTAETRAIFPGRSGTLYRALVIGTTIHARSLRRLLAGVRHRAE